LLRCFPLRPGANALLCRVRRTGAAVEFTLWLYDPQARFIVMDIDGTVMMTMADFLPGNVLV
jgi:phosphatidate phosphatase PAH1